jgi:peptidyl-prolyl cis-trans isomerase C
MSAGSKGIHLKYAVPVILALTMGVACNRNESASAATTSGEATATAPAAPGATPTAGQPADPNAPPAEPAKPIPEVLPDVVARVNGQPISKAELERAIRNLELNAGGAIPAERRAEIYRGVLDQLIDVKLLEQEAASRSIKATDAEVNQGIDEMKKQAPDQAAFDKALQARQMSEVDLRNEARQRLTVDKLLVAEIEPKAAVGAADIEAFYKGNPQFFMQPETVRASHILLKVEPGADAAAKQAARAKAEDVLKQVKAGGDFAALAQQHSQDGSAAGGGDLGFFPRGQMVKAFEDAAFGMKPGQVSDLVESEFGFHIIKVTDHRTARTVPLAEVNDRIAVALRQQKQQELAQQFVQELKAKGKVEILI